MTSIVELFPNTRRLMLDLQTQIQYVEKGHASPDEVRLRLEELNRQLKVLDGLAGQERPAQRENWRRKLKELANERDFVRDQLGKNDLGRRRKGQEARERQELLAQRYSALPASMVNYAREEDSWVRSRRMVGDYMQSGQASLASLIDQRARLKRAQRRVLDIVNVVGLSNSILRVSNRREAVDRLLVLGGMAVTTLFLYWLWKRG